MFVIVGLIVRLERFWCVEKYSRGGIRERKGGYVILKVMVSVFCFYCEWDGKLSKSFIYGSDLDFFFIEEWCYYIILV